MSSLMILSLFSGISAALLFSGISAARAEVGLRLGPRAGLEFENQDWFIGADVRLSFPLSPLTINLTFDYYFAEDQTLFQIGVNALYYVPTPARLLDPYVGVGVGLTSFSLDEVMDMGATDSHGNRFGLNLIGGVCFDLPVVSPFAQVMVSVGDIDLITIGGGFQFGVSGSKRWDSCGRRIGEP